MFTRTDMFVSILVDIKKKLLAILSFFTKYVAQTETHNRKHSTITHSVLHCVKMCVIIFQYDVITFNESMYSYRCFVKSLLCVTKIYIKKKKKIKNCFAQGAICENIDW